MDPETTPDVTNLSRRLARTRKALEEAEAVAESATSELYETVQELTRLNQTMRDFVATASHDLRGPITSVLGYSTTMIKKWATLSDEQKLEFIGTIERSARQLTALVDDLLTLSRIEAGALETHQKAIALGEAVEQAIRDFVDHAAHVRVSIPRVFVFADEEHLQRILVNFVSNAIKYGSPPIEVDATPAGLMVEIRVRDQGEGVPVEFVPMLFQKFARAETESSRSVKGTGLGLSIVDGLAKANGGEAWYEPNQPRGSIFGVRLPCPVG